MSDNSVSVVVVGAGVAGLSTAHHLRQAGFTNITILEASDRVGGRVKSVAPLEGEGAVELGATCIHGASRDNPVYALMEETGGQFCTEEGDRIDRSVAEKVWEIYMDMADDQDEQYKMHAKEGGSCTQTMSSEKFIQKAIPRMLQAFQEGKQRTAASSALNTMLNYTRFMDGSEMNHISADLVGCYVTPPGPEMLVTGRGYSLFVENLVKQIPGVNILFNREVTKIRWGGVPENDHHVIGDTCSTNPKAKVLCKNGDEYDADYVVVTCSLGHLKANHKTLFDPPLPESKAGAIERMGFGRSNKLFLYYEKPFWKEGVKLAWTTDTPNITTKSDWVRRILAFDTVPGNPHVLGGPVSGTGSEILETLTDDQVAADCTEVLRKFLNNPSIPSPTFILRSNWNTDHLYLGSYSYLSTESKDGDIEELASSLPGDRHPVLLFAGEATHPCYYSTVHGAYLSGVTASKKISDAQNSK
ncbi:hypothetical protein BaRGS_00001093 [Batillaria attramentaria]|uniref:Amine oxidase domain-containing protein n=1 Tax=Batillaria attramentaria TaxID=370345 RepID=A0ABD0M5X1_9CAEN